MLPGWHPHPPPPPPQAPVSAIFGRVIAFLGIAAALACCAVWAVVGMFSMAAGPLCLECAREWLPPVAVGVVGPLVPLGLWTVALVAQWRNPLLLVWSLAIWPVLGAANVWAIEDFAALFNG